MKQALKHRALVTLDGSRVAVHGTYHKPWDRMQETDLPASAAGRVALLFVNSLSTPRSGYGDSAVYWADLFAASGYPVFRIDLPGLGDSPGPIPSTLLTYITGGGYASLIRQKIRELAARFSLSGVVVAGHCAGAVTALHAASEHTLSKGLILMDPYFNYPKQLSPKLPPRLILWSRKTRMGTLVRNGYGWARELSRTEGLPDSTNFALLRQWKYVSARGVPMLVLQTLSSAPVAGQFDYLAYALTQTDRRSSIEVQTVANTDHSFSNEAGRNHVHKYAEAWLRRFFPIQAGSEFVPDAQVLR